MNINDVYDGNISPEIKLFKIDWLKKDGKINSKQQICVIVIVNQT